MTDTDNTIIDSQLFALLGWTTGNQSADDGELVVGLQGRANPFQGKTHADLEVLRCTWREVSSVRLDRHHVSVDEQLIDIRGVELRRTPGDPVITLMQRLLGLLVVATRKLEREEIVLDPFAPDVVKLIRVGRPACFLSSESVGLLDLVVEAGIQQHVGGGHPLLNTLAEHLEDVERRLYVTHAQKVVETGGVNLERLHIARQKDQTVRVQTLEITFEDLGRYGIVQRRLQVVVVVHQMHDEPGCLSMLRGHHQILGG